MKRSVLNENLTSVRVLKFALTQHNVSNSADVLAEMAGDFDRSVDLWNTYVKIDKEYQAKLKDMRCVAHDGYAEIVAQIDVLRDKDEAKSERSELYSKIKTARKEADKLIDISAWGLERRRALQQASWVENCGLISYTPRLMLSRFDVACKEAMKKGTRVKYHDKDGSGMIVFVLRQDAKSGDSLNLIELFNQDRNFCVKIHRPLGLGLIGDPDEKLTAAQKREMRSRVTLRIRKGVEVDFQLHQHRKFAPETIIKGCQLIAEREGRKIKYYLCFTVVQMRLPNPILQRGLKVIGLGCSINPDTHQTKIAEILGDDGVIRNTVMEGYGRDGVLGLRAPYCAQSAMQKRANTMIPLLKKYYWNEEDKFEAYVLKKIRAKSGTMPIGLMAKLAKMADKKELGIDLCDEIRGWWRVDNAGNETNEVMYDRLGATRTRSVRRRNAWYRNLAKRWVDGTCDIAVCNGLFDDEFVGLDMTAHQVFALSTLADFIKQRCDKIGVKFIKIDMPKLREGDEFDIFDVKNIAGSKRDS